MVKSKEVASLILRATEVVFAVNAARQAALQTQVQVMDVEQRKMASVLKKRLREI